MSKQYKSWFKSFLVSGIIISLTFGLGLFALAQEDQDQVSENETIEYGPSWEIECVDELCEGTFYSYQKYYLENDEWKEIDEKFDSVGCLEYDYCVDDNLYQVYVKDSLENDSIKYVVGSSEISFRPVSLVYRNNLNEEQVISNAINSNIEVSENVVTYNDIFGEGISLNYIYLPDLLKQELVIGEKNNLPEPTISLDGLTLDVDFEIDYNLEANIDGEPWDKETEKETDEQIDFIKDGETIFFIPEAVAYDSNYSYSDLKYEFKDENDNEIVSLKTDYEWISSNEVSYPLVIDPSIDLNHSNVLWNGYVVNQTDVASGVSNYTRISNPASSISIGKIPAFQNATSGTSKRARGAIDWDISTFSDDSDIRNLTLRVYLAHTESDSDIYVNVTNLERNNSQYANIDADCGTAQNGNCLYYSDMGNGTIYSSSNFFGNNILASIVLSSEAAEEFEGSLNKNVFSLGVYGNELNNLAIRSKDATNSSQRPVLKVVYQISESEGDLAIVKGINNSLANNPIESSQQIYLVNETGGHFLGTFDKATILKNQTWGFNYVTAGQGFINMPSMLRIVNTWENNSLAFEEIVSQVELFINSTRF